MDTRLKKILSSVVIFHIFNDAAVTALPAIFPILYTEGIIIRRYSDIGTIVFIGLSVAVALQFAIGHWVKGRHYRTFLALDVLIVGVSLLLTPLSGSFAAMLACFIGVRIGSSIYHPVGIAWVTHSFSGEERDRAMGIQSGFGDIGVLLAFTLTGLLAQRFGWKIPIGVWGALCIASCAAGLLVSRGISEETSIKDENESVSWRETWNDQRLFTIPILLGGIAWGITLAYGPSLLNHRLHVSMSGTGIILGVWIAMGALASLFYGKIVERIGRFRLLLACYATTSVTTFVIGLSRSAALVTIAFILFGLALFVTFPAILTLIGSLSKAHNRTAAFSMVANLQVVGNLVFSYVAGFLSDLYGIQSPFVLLGSIALVIVIYMTAIRGKAEAAPGGSSAFVGPRDIASA